MCTGLFTATFDFFFSEQKARWEQEAKNVRTQYNKEVEMYNQKKSKNTATNDINKKAV